MNTLNKLTSALTKIRIGYSELEAVYLEEARRHVALGEENESLQLGHEAANIREALEHLGEVENRLLRERKSL